MAELSRRRAISAGIATAYDRAAGAWAAGPDLLYERLAAALVAACPPLAGRRVLDVGAGTGALSRAITQAGGEVVAVDVAIGMLAQRRELRPPAVVGDVHGLPFADAVFDAVMAGFVLNHLPEPAAALHEISRVTCPGGTVAASTFAADWSHPSKDAIDAVAARFGYLPPPWYTMMKSQAAPAAGEPDALVAAAHTAGLTDATTLQRCVDGGLTSPAAQVSWRLGMAHLAPFVAELPPAERERLVAAAIAAVGPEPPPVCPRVVILTARVP